jgi:oligopeptide/dipeptide ABC transporter ATP-binding protein
MAPVLEVTDLSVAFANRGGGWRASDVTVVDRVSLTIAPGEIVGLVGESGSGKSTTARGILRLIPSSGRIVLHGVDISGLADRQLRPHRRHAQMVFQDPYSSLDPAMTVAALLTEAMRLDGVKRTRREARERATELLQQVGLGAIHLDRYPAEFSGGQRQRVAIARALASRPSLIICDEAVSALDVSTQRQIIRLLRRLRNETGVAILFIAHDLAIVRQIADRTIVMYCGQLVEQGRSVELFDQPAHPYTLALLSAVPVPAPARQRGRHRLILSGDAPNPAAPPSGCRFHERCPFVMDVCRTTEPITTEIGDHTVRCHLHQLDSPLPWTVVDDEIISDVAVSIEEEEEREDHDGTTDGVAVGAPNGEHG